MLQRQEGGRDNRANFPSRHSTAYLTNTSNSLAPTSFTHDKAGILISVSLLSDSHFSGGSKFTLERKTGERFLFCFCSLILNTPSAHHTLSHGPLSP